MSHQGLLIRRGKHDFFSSQVSHKEKDGPESFPLIFKNNKRCWFRWLKDREFALSSEIAKFHFRRLGKH